ncbi:hypothetical protein F3Y22_tig00112249pilonHSYRG00367 [Hibiscus syriacus]|uniref:Uncharacterized protein n=1 Tax=Hibiscus syriacus TaxID=106335 RepID=A0A6A2YAW9_HIBSY|nr:hypothetical protein F3Y22_tig00112249pilonHSYRG00367 [Hibiscus syriacus]
MTTTGTRYCKGRMISKRRRLGNPGPNWSDLPLDILERECRLLDPLSRDYLVEQGRRGIECGVFVNARPCASSYGWVLFKVSDFSTEEEKESLFLYSPLTSGVIKLPHLGEHPTIQAVTFALNATSPKCKRLGSFEEMSKETLDYFTNLIGKADDKVKECNVNLIRNLLHCSIPDGAGDFLTRPVTAEEINEAIYSCRTGEMTTTTTTTGTRNSKGRRISKRRRRGKHGPNWSDLPLDILERIIGRLRWADRIRLRAVCKAWSVPNTHIPAIDGELPWAMKFCWRIAASSLVRGECRLLDPFSREYLVEEERRIECGVFLDAIPCASSYGWVLFKVFDFIEEKESLFLYSPFTTEVIKLPHLGEPPTFLVATFALNATSPKCTIFLLWSKYGKIYIKLCSAGDCSWKTFEFDGFDWPNPAVDAAYANGVFYCVFRGGQLGAFDVEHTEWTILVDHRLPVNSLAGAKLIVSDADLLLLSDSTSLELLKLDFSKMAWVNENDLNNRVLFVGCTCFSVPAVGETSQLANTIFASGTWLHPKVRFCGSTSPSWSELHRKYVEAAEYNRTWIELPLGGIWRADDLIRAV